MRKSVRTKIIIVVLAGVFCAGLGSVLLNADAEAGGRDAYIEVGGDKPVYVPRTAQYVKLNGKVRKIARFAASLGEGEEDCKCPKCCDGYCYVFVIVDGGPANKPIRILYIIWLEC